MSEVGKEDGVNCYSVPRLPDGCGIYFSQFTTPPGPSGDPGVPQARREGGTSAPGEPPHVPAWVVSRQSDPLTRVGLWRRLGGLEPSLLLPSA